MKLVSETVFFVICGAIDQMTFLPETKHPKLLKFFKRKIRINGFEIIKLRWYVLKTFFLLVFKYKNKMGTRIYSKVM